MTKQTFLIPETFLFEKNEEGKLLKQLLESCKNALGYIMTTEQSFNFNKNIEIVDRNEDEKMGDNDHLITTPNEVQELVQSWIEILNLDEKIASYFIGDELENDENQQIAVDISFKQNSDRDFLFQVISAQSISFEYDCEDPRIEYAEFDYSMFIDYILEHSSFKPLKFDRIRDIDSDREYCDLQLIFTQINPKPKIKKVKKVRPDLGNLIKSKKKVIE